jgi:quinol monooxygenase YgiN
LYGSRKANKKDKVGQTMMEVGVIARFETRKGKEDQLKALLHSMLAPKPAELGCKAYDLYEPASSERFYVCETWKSQAAVGQYAC